MEELEIRYKIPEAKLTIDKRTGKKAYKINDFWWYENGIRKRSDTRYHQTAEECRVEALARISNNADKIYIASKMSVEGLITQYREEVRKLPLAKCAPSTKKNRYTNSSALLKHLSNDCLKIKLTKFSLDDLDEMLSYLKNNAKTDKGKNISTEYYQSLKYTLVHIFNFAKEQGYFKGSLDRFTEIMNFLKLKEESQVSRGFTERKEFRYIEFEDFKKFAVACLYDIDKEDDIQYFVFTTFNEFPQFNFKKITKENMIFFMFFNCMMFLGTRTEECRVLGANDLDFEANDNKGRVNINKAFTSDYFEEDIDEYMGILPTKTSQSNRKIPMKTQLRVFLIKYLEYMKQNDMPLDKLFPGNDQGYLSYKTIDYKIKTTLKKAGMKGKHFSKHDFRRSCAMMLCYDLNADRDKITPYFGWKTTEMLDEVYAKFDEIQKAKGVETHLEEKGFFDKPLNIFEIKNGKYTTGSQVVKPNDEYLEYYTDKKTKYKPIVSKKKKD